MPYKLIHWHEHGLLGNEMPTNQLVANVWEPKLIYMIEHSARWSSIELTT
jgi:hypothetical protein